MRLRIFWGSVAATVHRPSRYPTWGGQSDSLRSAESGSRTPYSRGTPTQRAPPPNPGLSGGQPAVVGVCDSARPQRPPYNSFLPHDPAGAPQFTWRTRRRTSPYESGRGRVDRQSARARARSGPRRAAGGGAPVRRAREPLRRHRRARATPRTCPRHASWPCSRHGGPVAGRSARQQPPWERQPPPPCNRTPRFFPPAMPCSGQAGTCPGGTPMAWPPVCRHCPSAPPWTGRARRGAFCTVCESPSAHAAADCSGAPSPRLSGAPPTGKPRGCLGQGGGGCLRAFFFRGILRCAVVLSSPTVARSGRPI